MSDIIKVRRFDAIKDCVGINVITSDEYSHVTYASDESSSPLRGTLQELQDIEIEGIDHSDYPDFCDAFIASASWNNGEELTDEELEYLNDNHREFVYEQTITKVF